MQDFIFVLIPSTEKIVLELKQSELGWYDYVKDGITLLASLATVLTILFIYKQRKDSFRPKLLVLFNNEVSIVPKTHYDLWTWQSLTTGQHPTFSIVNSGNGLAEDIEYKCYFDNDKMFRFLKNLDKQGIFDFEDQNLLYYIRNAKEDRGTTVFKPYIINSGGKMSALIDLKTNIDSKKDIPFNPTYLKLLSSAEYILKENEMADIEGNTHLLDFPKVYYSISYKNTENNKYYTYYQLWVHRTKKLQYSFHFTKINKIPKNIPRISKA